MEFVAAIELTSDYQFQKMTNDIDVDYVSDMPNYRNRLKHENFKKRSKAALCFLAFIALLGFGSTIFGGLLSFLHDISQNNNFIHALEKYFSCKSVNTSIYGNNEEQKDFMRNINNISH